MKEPKNTFAYSYSSREQEEIKKIREKYESPEKKEGDTLERLRLLDARVTAKGTAVSLALGILGTLVMGVGMSLVMTKLGAALGLAAMPLGIGIGLFGILSVALAYPAYLGITKKERERIAPEIIRLTDELLK